MSLITFTKEDYKLQEEFLEKHKEAHQIEVDSRTGLVTKAIYFGPLYVTEQEALRFWQQVQNGMNQMVSEDEDIS